MVKIRNFVYDKVSYKLIVFEEEIVHSLNKEKYIYQRSC